MSHDAGLAAAAAGGDQALVDELLGRAEVGGVELLDSDGQFVSIRPDAAMGNRVSNKPMHLTQMRKSSDIRDISAYSAIRTVTPELPFRSPNSLSWPQAGFPGGW
jgi:hypothetical protein